MSAESVTGYPRWQGQLARGPRAFAIAGHEVRRAIDDQWGRSILTVVFGFALLSVGNLYSVARTSPATHSVDNFVQFLGILRWGGLAIAAVMAGPALLEDAQRGALELYLSRAVTRRDYLLGKILAVVGVTLVAVFGPAVVYILGATIVLDTHPAGWGWMWLGSLGYATLWAVTVAGVGLGLSCVMRSARAASLVLFGGFATLDIILGGLLTAITRTTDPQVLSPLASLQEQVQWLFPGAHLPYDFPYWWGLICLGIVATVGWTLVWWRHPRLKGVE